MSIAREYRKRNVGRNWGQCKLCGDVIESKFRHDFVSCMCGACSLDGGHDYRKFSGELENFEDWGGPTFSVERMVTSKPLEDYLL